MRNVVFLLLTQIFGSLPARAEASLLATEATAVTWPSAEGAALRLAPGAMVLFGKGQHLRSAGLVYGYDVFSHSDPFHHWELGYGDGPNGAYFGVRYQNKNHVDQYEGGVVLGAPFLNFGVGLIYDAGERKLHAVELRATLPILSLPVMIWEKLREVPKGS